MARFNNQAGACNQSASTNSGKAESRSPYSLSAFAMIDKIFHLISEAKHNKVHVEKFRETLEQILKALNGMDVFFIRNAEFYPDLKETLSKIHYHIANASTRNKWLKFMMAKKDLVTQEEIQKHVDNLVCRIVFSYAQRTKQRRNTPPLPTSDEESCALVGSADCCSETSLDLTR